MMCLMQILKTSTEDLSSLRTLLGKMINLPKKPSPSLMVVLGIPLAGMFSYYCFLKVGFNLTDFKENLDNRFIVTDRLFDPKWSWAIENASEALVETIQIAILASVVGCFLALPLSFYASQTTNQNTISYFIYKSFLNLVRTIPDLFWAMMFTVAVGLGPFAGVLALVMFSLAIMGKLLSETIDSIDPGPLEAAKSSGASHNQSVFTSALPQVLPNFTAYFLYIFELCIRASVILGLVGAGGVGRIIETQRIFLRFDRITPIIVLILVVVILIEQFSVWLRRRIL
ncbi:MAG: phosphonate ABC transporter, permease protein PhnE [Euryarchaeota archaeon]|nr:phosphonate ABC transporter, permease protein PhnE [Euryarchaeota archaeon]